MFIDFSRCKDVTYLVLKQFGLSKDFNIYQSFPSTVQFPEDRLEFGCKMEEFCRSVFTN